MLKYSLFTSTIRYVIIPQIPKLLQKKIYIVFFIQYKNEWKEHKFWRQEDQEKRFLQKQKAFKIDDIEVNKIVLSKEEPYGIIKATKYFIGYIDNDVVRPICIMPPQMVGYAKNFESNKTMSFKLMITNY